MTLFVSNLERIARTPRLLAVGVFFSAVGWLFLAPSLWLSLYSLGYAIPVEAPLFIVPLAMTASMTPLPGGSGGIDAAYIILLVGVDERAASDDYGRTSRLSGSDVSAPHRRSVVQPSRFSKPAGENGTIVTI